MHANIEQLVQLRDRELATDAAVARHVAHCHACRRRLQEITRLRQGLQDLPLCEAPAGDWTHIANRAAAKRRPARWVWSVAATMLIALGLTQRMARDPSTPVGSAEQAQTLALVRESQQLDRALGALAPDYRVMRGRTASTLARLEDDVAALDYQINLLDARHPRRFAQRKELWRQRVDLMRSLYTVQYAQAYYRPTPVEPR